MNNLCDCCYWKRRDATTGHFPGTCGTIVMWAIQDGSSRLTKKSLLPRRRRNTAVAEADDLVSSLMKTNLRIIDGFLPTSV
jgi:hypothetical protein